MKKWGFIWLTAIVLFLLVGCGSKVADHTEAVEALFTKTEKAAVVKEAATDEELLDMIIYSNNSTGLSEEELLKMLRVLLDEGELDADDAPFPDTEIEMRYRSYGITPKNRALWAQVISMKDFKNLEEQLQPQYDKLREADKDRKSYEYTVDFWLPNVAKLSAQDLTLEIPTFDFEEYHKDNVYYDTYTSDMEQVVKEGLLTYLDSDEKFATQKTSVKVKVTENDDKEITAQFVDEGLDKIESGIYENEASFLKTIEELDEWQLANATSDLRKQLDVAVTAAAAPKIASVEGKDGQYTATLLLVDDLGAKLAALRDQKNNYYKNFYADGLYSPIAETTIKQNLANDLSKETFTYSTEKKIDIGYLSYHVTIDQADQDALKKAISDPIQNTVGEIKKYLDDNVLKKPVERPATSVLSGSNAGSPIAMEIPSDSGDYYVKFVSFVNNETGDSVLTAYIREGEGLTVSLPAGSYKLRFARGKGDSWYGEDGIFGPDARYSQARDVVTIEGGYTYELKLYGVAGGNLPIDSLGDDNF